MEINLSVLSSRELALVVERDPRTHNDPLLQELLRRLSPDWQLTRRETYIYRGASHANTGVATRVW